jgi:hypothetical protein
VETPDTPFGPNKLGRKHIKSFASGIAHMFSCSAQHYAWLAYQHRLPTVTIDLLDLRIEPSEFDIERNRILAGMCQRTLLRNAEQLHHLALWYGVSLAHSGLMTIRKTAVLPRLAGRFHRNPDR